MVLKSFNVWSPDTQFRPIVYIKRTGCIIKFWVNLSNGYKFLTLGRVVFCFKQEKTKRTFFFLVSSNRGDPDVRTDRLWPTSTSSQGPRTKPTPHKEVDLRQGW